MTIQTNKSALGSSIVDKKLVWILILLGLSVSFAFQGSRGLFETSEGRCAESAREMIESGNYIEPTLDYAPHWSKPPLFYWSIALGYNLIGHYEWGLRFFNAIAFFLSTLAVVGVGKTIWSIRTGIIAGLIYTTSIFPVAGAFVLTTDTLLAFWEIISVFCFVMACESTFPAKRNTWILAMYASLGFGFLTKGPPALIPLLSILIWKLRTKRPAGLFNPFGVLVFFITGLSWYLLVIHLHPELISYFIGTEIIDRFVSDTVHNHGWFGPFKEYAPVLLLGGGIWSIFGIRFVLKNRFLNPKRLWKLLQKSKYEFFLVSWIVLAIVIFSLAKSRLPLYVLPLHAPITLLIARGFTADRQTENSIGKIVWIRVGTAFFLICIKGVSAYYPQPHNMKNLYNFCRKVGGENLNVAVFNKKNLYGLDYYLSGQLERVSISGKQEWANKSIDDLIDEIDSTPPNRRWVIVSDHNNNSQVTQMIANHGKTYDENRYENWVVVVVHGKHIS